MSNTNIFHLELEDMEAATWPGPSPLRSEDCLQQTKCPSPSTRQPSTMEEDLLRMLWEILWSTGGQMFVSTLGIRTRWQHLKPQHGELHAFLEQLPELFVLSSPSTMVASVRLTTPPGLQESGGHGEVDARTCRSRATSATRSLGPASEIQAELSEVDDLSEDDPVSQVSREYDAFLQRLEGEASDEPQAIGKQPMVDNEGKELEEGDAKMPYEMYTAEDDQHWPPQGPAGSVSLHEKVWLAQQQASAVQFVNGAFKTQLCRYDSMGHCNRADSCTFAHGMAELHLFHEQRRQQRSWLPSFGSV